MGQYKVPQDVEAEDKLIGPLSLRQFIYVVIGLGWAGLMFLLFSKVVIVMIIAILPITGFFLLLGFGRRQEQSFDNYLAAVVKFFVEPRIRVWDKDLSQSELVKKEEKAPEIIPTKNVNVGSLKQLAMIMDTHGAQKDPTIQLQDESSVVSAYGQRVINPTQVVGGLESIPSQAKTTQTDDVLDATNAHNTQVGEMLENVEANIHSKAVSNIKQNLSSTQEPTKQSNSHLQTSSAIIKRAIFQSNNLTVEQLARESSENIMPEGQIIKISPSS
jgi:hypothetical protein